MNEYSYQERHMGTDVSLSFICNNVDTADIMARNTFVTIHNYELLFSRFIENSELSRLNAEGTRKVSPEFIEVLEKSLELHHLTNGAFNPLLQVKTLGYNQTFSEIKDTTTNLVPVIYNTDLKQITIDRISNTVTLAKNQQLDFGGILKGFLAAKLADAICKDQPTYQGLIINIGGDLATRGVGELHKPFMFELYNPITGAETPVALTDTSLATSGTYARVWQTNNGSRHHIVDPENLQNPSQDLVSVSIIHQDGATTEAMTKLFLVRGVAEALSIAPPEKCHYQYFVVSSNGNTLTNLI